MCERHVQASHFLRRVAAAYGVAHLALRTPFYVQNHDVAAHHGRVTTVDALRAWEHWSTGVVLFRSRHTTIALHAVLDNKIDEQPSLIKPSEAHRAAGWS